MIALPDQPANVSTIAGLGAMKRRRFAAGK